MSPHGESETSEVLTSSGSVFYKVDMILSDCVEINHQSPFASVSQPSATPQLLVSLPICHELLPTFSQFKLCIPYIYIHRTNKGLSLVSCHPPIPSSSNHSNHHFPPQEAQSHLDMISYINVYYYSGEI